VSLSESPATASSPAAVAPGAAATPDQRDQDIYDRHAARLYNQALLTLGDTAMAEQVVSDVIVDSAQYSASSYSAA